jgi:hypothetical protein
VGWYLFTDPLFYVRQAVMVTAVAGLCLVAIWAGVSRRHWFVRAAAVWAGIAALLPIGAHQPARMFLFVLPAIAVVILAIRRWLIPPTDACRAGARVPAGWIRFSLRDLFLAVLLTGAVFATAMAAWRTHREHLWTWWLFATGGCLALLAVLSTVAALVSRRRLLWLLALGASVAGAAALHTWLVPNWQFLSHLHWAVEVPFITAAEVLLALALAFFEFCALIFPTLSLARCAAARTGDSRCSARRFVACGLLVAEGCVLLLPLAVFYGHMLRRPRLPEVSYPRENNYPQLLAAAEKLTSLNGTELTVADLQRKGASAEIAKQVAELHTTILAMVAQPGHATFDREIDVVRDAAGRPWPRCLVFSSVARMWSAEAEAAAKARRFDEASRYGVGCIHVGNVLSQGGPMLYSLVGGVVESIGVDSLSRIRRGLSASQLRAILADLEQIEQAREPAEVALAREAVYEDEISGWVSRVPYATAKLTGKEYRTKKLVSNRRFIHQRDALLRLLKTDLALRLFRQERGRVPERLDELVPKYLAAIPVDPFSNQPLVYRRGDTDYLLYSVGADGEDNGARFGSSFDTYSRGYDLDLDALGRDSSQR